MRTRSRTKLTCRIILNPGWAYLAIGRRQSAGLSEVREKEELPIAVRPIEPADVPEAGRICHDAFKAIAGQHNFPPDFREPQVAIDLLSQLTANRGFYGLSLSRMAGLSAAILWTSVHRLSGSGPSR